MGEAWKGVGGGAPVFHHVPRGTFCETAYIPDVALFFAFPADALHTAQLISMASISYAVLKSVFRGINCRRHA